MLLRHTEKTIAERTALTVNPAKTCQPIGAMYAALGVHRCLPHSHGSQGCCAYHRSALTRHYKEPVMAATSSFTEGASVFGGQANLIDAVTNIFALYGPDIIAVHTTCLSEVIGDDIKQIIGKMIAEGKIPRGKRVIHTNTPSFKGSHVTGYSNMTASLVSYLAKEAKARTEKINIIPGFIEPSDMAEIKRIATEMGVRHILFPDTSGVLNGPLDGKFRMFPKTGATVEQIEASGNAAFTMTLGSAALAAGRLLDTKCKVPLASGELPVGLRATDAMVETLRRVTGRQVPDTITLERGQLVDVICDTNQYFYGRKAALAGDPDILVPLTEFLTDLGMKITCVVTGTPAGGKFEKKIKDLTGEGTVVRHGPQADLYLFHQLVKNDRPDIILGNTYLKYIARDEDIPHLRLGFPIYDRVGHQYFPVTGYRGALRLVERMLGIILDRQDRDAPEESFELVM